MIPIQVTAEAPQQRQEKACQAFYAKFPHTDEAVWVTMDSFAGWVRGAPQTTQIIGRNMTTTQSPP